MSARKSPRRKRVVEHRHQIVEGEFEVSVAIPPRAFIRELKSVFPGAINDFNEVCTFDLNSIGIIDHKSG